MHNSIKLIAAAAFAGSLMTAPVIAAPALTKAAPQVRATTAVPIFWRFQGGCFVHYQKTIIQPNGRVGPPGYERYYENQWECFFSI